MSAEESSDNRVAVIMQHGQQSAAADGSPKVHLRHLTDEEVEELAAVTLEYLRSRSGTRSHLEGWQKLSPRAARVVPWWKESAGLSESERRRLGSLREEVYDVLAQRGLLEKEPGKGASIHVSPEGYLPEMSGAKQPAVAVGAWVLKGAPHIFDLNVVFMDPSRLVRKWAVEIPDRAAGMQPGQLVYFWVRDGDPYRVPGIWGAGRVTGACSAGAAGNGWLNAEAAARATLFADVEVVLWDLPVPRDAFLADPRLADAEMVREPWSDNPSYLTPDETAALGEYHGIPAAVPATHG